jgi:periodic tryptophan protein 2
LKKIQNKHSSDIKGMSWSPDSRFVLTWGRDNSVIVNPVFRLRLYRDIVLQAHKVGIVSAFFRGMQSMVTVDELGKMCIWRWVSDFVSEGYKKHQQLVLEKKQRNITRNAEQQEDEEYSPMEL